MSASVLLGQSQGPSEAASRAATSKETINTFHLSMDKRACNLFLSMPTGRPACFQWRFKKFDRRMADKNVCDFLVPECTSSLPCHQLHCPYYLTTQGQSVSVSRFHQLFGAAKQNIPNMTLSVSTTTVLARIFLFALFSLLQLRYRIINVCQRMKYRWVDDRCQLDSYDMFWTKRCICPEFSTITDITIPKPQS